MSTIASTGIVPDARTAGTWRLLPGQALTLQPRRAGTVRVSAGTLWATGDGPHRGPANARGDRVLAPGETLDIRAGERLVIEAVGSAEPARFAWDPVPPWDARRGSPSALAWRVALLLPATALTAALWWGAAVVSDGHRSDIASTAAAGA